MSEKKNRLKETDKCEEDEAVYPEDPDVGMLLIQYRMLTGLTVKQLSGFLNISESLYKDLESNKADITLTQVEKLANLYGLTFEEFLKGEVRETMSMFLAGYCVEDLIAIAETMKISLNLGEMNDCLQRSQKI